MNMSPAVSLKQQLHKTSTIELGRVGTFLQPVIFGLVRAVLLSSLGSDYPLHQISCRTAADHTALKVLGMPGFLRLPMIILTIGFDVGGLFFGGKLFRYLSSDKQQEQFQAWQKSPIGPCRDVVLFYQKLGVFIYFSVTESDKENA